MLDAARRTVDDDLFQRAVEIALQARAGDQALAATRLAAGAAEVGGSAAHAGADPVGLNRGDDLAEPLTACWRPTPAMERPG
jgi:hypothetical protein